MMELSVLREKVLSDCAPNEAFWTCNGTVCRNIYELESNIRALNEWAFRYHVNLDNGKNDFARWIEDVIKDHELAARLGRTTDRDRYVDIIHQRIRELECN